MNQAPGSGHRLRWRATLITLALVAASLVVTSPVAADVRVTVRAGDSLSLLSLEYGVSVSAIMAANGITNPDLLYMGQELVIPGVGPSAATTSVVVTVEWGDSLSAIAADYGVSVSALMACRDHFCRQDRRWSRSPLETPSRRSPRGTGWAFRR